jgi:hypothetical protein
VAALLRTRSARAAKYEPSFYGDEPMARLTLDQLLAGPALKELTVEFPELGGDVLLRELTADRLQQARTESTLKSNTRSGGKAGEVDQSMFEVNLILYTVVDPVIEKLHLLKLKQLPQSVFMRLLRAAMDVNGLSQEATREADQTFPESEGQGE